MLVFLGYVIAALGVLAIALALFVWKQGDAEFFFDVSQRSSLVLEKETAKNFEKYRVDAVCIVLNEDKTVRSIKHYENLY